MIAQTQIRGRRRKTSNTRHKNKTTTSSPSGHSLQPAAIPRNVPVSLSTVGEAAPPSHEQIATRAYQIWEANGRPAGTDYEDWFEAEGLLRVEAH
jgi:hypothetical protein